jgi:hypothetical protein
MPSAISRARTLSCNGALNPARNLTAASSSMTSATNVGTTGPPAIDGLSPPTRPSGDHLDGQAVESALEKQFSSCDDDGSARFLTAAPRGEIGWHLGDPHLPRSLRSPPLAHILATTERDDDADNPLREAFGNEANDKDIEEFALRFGVQVEHGFGQRRTRSS